MELLLFRQTKGVQMNLSVIQFCEAYIASTFAKS